MMCLYICEHCRRPIHRVRYNGVCFWEHVIPPGEHHGPFPRTLCQTGGIGEDDLQAVPYFEQMVSQDDKQFLRSLKIEV
jgi:hypothetical protein